MIQRSTIQLLRFHFSFFLLPVFLFAISQVEMVNWRHVFFVFIILHLLVYPASNGYNSYVDKDTKAIGGLANPMMPTKQLYYVTIVMDVAAVLLALFTIDVWFAFGIMLYIVTSRAYSYRDIRFKKYPVTGYLTVIVFQGAFMFAIVYYACSVSTQLHVPWLCMLAAACLIGGYYPLTQVYQHAEDKRDGVYTISMLLGIRWTFAFCSIIFALAATCFWYLAYIKQDKRIFHLFMICMLPVFLFFLWWMQQVWRDAEKANFKNSLWMNVTASFCASAYFLTLIFL